MIPLSLRISILLAIGVYFVLLVILLRKKSLTLRYSLLWLFTGLVMLFFTLFPGLLAWMTALLGFKLGSNALFAILFFCLLIILISLTSVISRQGEAIKRLSQEHALLEKRLRELEERRQEEN